MKPSNFVDISRNSIKEKSENWVILMHLKNCPLGFPCKVFLKVKFFRMIRLKTVFSDVKPETLYDVLHDPDYRKVQNQNLENQICKIWEIKLMIKTLKKVQKTRDCN